MKFGDEEWFEKSNEKAKFPSVFAFYVSNEGAVFSSVIQTKAENVGNIKYSRFSPNDFCTKKDEDVALTDVIRLHTANDYYDKCRKIMKVWSKLQEVER